MRLLQLTNACIPRPDALIEPVLRCWTIVLKWETIVPSVSDCSSLCTPTRTPSSAPTLVLSFSTTRLGSVLLADGDVPLTPRFGQRSSAPSRRLCWKAADTLWEGAPGGERWQPAEQVQVWAARGVAKTFEQSETGAGAGPEHSRVLAGVMLKRDLTHRRMPRSILAPRWGERRGLSHCCASTAVICWALRSLSDTERCPDAVVRRVLCILGGIEYHRTEARLASIDTLLEQEGQYLRLMVAAVLACNPHVILIERTVARAAQDLLLEHGVAMALG